MSETTDNEDPLKGYKETLRRIKRESTSVTYDERAVLIRDGEITGDPLVDMFFEDPLPELAVDLLRLKNSDSKRMYVEACILCSSDSARIADILDMSEDLIEAYRQLYYNTYSLDRLEKLRLVELIKDEREQHLKMWSISQGLDFISWRLGKAPRISPVDGLTSLYSDCIFKAKEAFYNANNTDSSKEGLRWAKQATDVARLLKAWVSDTDEASRDIKIALSEITGHDIVFPSMEDLVDGKDIGDYARDAEAVGGDEIDFPSMDDLNDESD